MSSPKQLYTKCADKVRGSDGCGAYGVIFPLSDFTLVVSLQILRLPFLGSCSSSFPDSLPQKKWAQPTCLIQLSLFFNVHTGRRKKLPGNCCGCSRSTLCVLSQCVAPPPPKQSWNTGDRLLYCISCPIEKYKDVPAVKRSTATVR